MIKTYITKPIIERDRLKFYEAWVNSVPVLIDSSEYLIKTIDDAVITFVAFDKAIQRYLKHPKSKRGTKSPTFYCMGCKSQKPFQGQVYGRLNIRSPYIHYCKECSKKSPLELYFDRNSGS